jgi:hypothetical protein
MQAMTAATNTQKDCLPAIRASAECVRQDITSSRLAKFLVSFSVAFPLAPKLHRWRR